MSYPERVDALLLMDTRAGIDSDIVKNMYLQTRDLWAGKQTADELIENLLHGIIGEANSNEIEAYHAIWRDRWREVSKEAMFAAMNNLIYRDEISHELHKITAPAIVLHATNDTGIPIAQGKALYEGLANAIDFVALPGGHASVMTHAPENHEHISEFLLKVYESQTTMA